MIKVVLLDLDNTLLINPDDRFVGAFLRIINEHFTQDTGYADIATQIRHMILALSDERDMVTTNSDIALKNMVINTGLSPIVLQQSFDKFYQTDYEDLRVYTAPADNNRKLIESLLNQGLTLAIATNPIYPEVGIYRRLEWAGLSDFIGDFAFITHADNVHFAKPNPAYYAEIIARIGVEPDEVIMVGDSLKNDILPAQKIGLHTFHLTQEATPADCYGTLLDFINMIQRQDWRDHFTPKLYDPDMLEAQFRGNIGALYGLLSQVESNYWHQRPDPNEWSILQILCHLRDSEEIIQRARIQRILTQDNPFIIASTPPGPDIPVCDADGYKIASEFVQEREKTIKLLSTLNSDDWKRPARHSIFGMTTLLEMAHFTAQHDRLHITQLCQTLGKCE